MAKKILLTVQERFGISRILNDAYGKGGLTLEFLSEAQRLLDSTSLKIEFEKKPDKDGVFFASNPEFKDINMRQATVLNDGKPMSQLMWDSTKDKGKEIEMTSDQVKLLVDLIKLKSDKKELKLEDTFLVDLNKKLNA